MARPAIHPGEILADELSELQITPTELARLFEVSQNIQHRILGKDEDNEACEFHLHFDAPDPEREYEQPEAVLAARKKAQQEKHQQVQGEQEAM